MEGDVHAISPTNAGIALSPAPTAIETAQPFLETMVEELLEGKNDGIQCPLCAMLEESSCKCLVHTVQEDPDLTYQPNQFLPKIDLLPKEQCALCPMLRGCKCLSHFA